MQTVWELEFKGKLIELVTAGHGSDFIVEAATINGIDIDLTQEIYEAALEADSDRMIDLADFLNSEIF